MHKINSQAIDKEMLKAALEELLRERNPELEGFLEELLLKFFSAKAMTDSATPVDMVSIREKYALRREAFAPLNTLFKDAPPAADLVKKLHK